MKNDTWWLTSSALSVTDTPTVGWSSGGTDCSLSLERLGGCRMKAPSIVTERRVRSVPLFSNPSRLTSVLPSDWFPQHRWICVEHTSPLPQMTVTHWSTRSCWALPEQRAAERERGARLCHCCGYAQTHAQAQSLDWGGSGKVHWWHHCPGGYNRTRSLKLQKKPSLSWRSTENSDMRNIQSSDTTRDIAWVYQTLTCSSLLAKASVTDNTNMSVQRSSGPIWW